MKKPMPQSCPMCKKPGYLCLDCGRCPACGCDPRCQADYCDLTADPLPYPPEPTFAPPDDDSEWLELTDDVNDLLQDFLLASEGPHLPICGTNGHANGPDGGGPVAPF